MRSSSGPPSSLPLTPGACTSLTPPPTWLPSPTGGYSTCGPGTVREPDRDADRYITRRLGFATIDRSEPTEWLNALRRLFDDDEIAWLQAWFGYSLTGHAEEKVFLFVSGPRNGGKSTIGGTLALLAGGYHRSVPEDAFTNENQRHREYLARIDGARVVTATELAQGTWRSGTLKTLTGGGLDTVTANRMRENSRDFRPVAKLTFCGNKRPRIPGGADSGLAGCIINVTLPTIPDEHLDDRLSAKIESELPRIASWALEGAQIIRGGGRDAGSRMDTGNLVSRVPPFFRYVRTRFGHGPAVVSITATARIIPPGPGSGASMWRSPWLWPARVSCGATVRGVGA